MVPGDHGSQLDVGFVLEVPDELDVPPEGSLRLPLDAEWREVSGYPEPEDYAPRIASRLMRNIHQHVRAHEGDQGDAPDLPSALRRHGAPRDEAFDSYEELLASRVWSENFLMLWEGELVTSTREKRPRRHLPRLRCE